VHAESAFEHCTFAASSTQHADFVAHMNVSRPLATIELTCDARVSELVEKPSDRLDGRA
jgi:hypothetical protein